MEDRDKNLISIRPILEIKTFDLTTIEENFQNQTLRPILKIQNDLLIQIFIRNCVKQKSTFFELSVNKKLDYIEQSIQNDTKFRDLLKGIIIGFFTLHEYNIYSQNASNINKRMMSMLIERFKNQVQIIEKSNPE